MFEFLLLSPSYELARRARSGQLTAADRARLPGDFKQVLATYDLLGDVNGILFRQWWLRRGLHVFGNPFSRPQIHQIALLKSGEDTDVPALSNRLKRQLVEQRQSEGLSASLVVALPMTLKKSEILRLIRKLLDQHQDLGTENTAPPKLRIQGQRFHPKAMLKGLRLLWFKAARPQWENWRLGARARISDSYSPELNPRSPRRAATPIEMDDRIILGKITHRAVKRFELIAENAARGRFPSVEPVAALDFDYPTLAIRLQENSRWVKQYKQDWLRANGKSGAKASG